MIPQYEPLITEADATAVSEYMRSGGWLTEHRVTREFERRIADAVQVKHAVAVNNGTVAISLALLAGGVQPGDYVLVPDLTMVATSFAVELIGARPIFVDIDYHNLCMDLSRAEEIITLLSEDEMSKPRALVYVSLNGRWETSSLAQRLFEHCNESGILFIEDAAQAFGSGTIHGPVGTLADMTTFSFSPHKIITTGQGGAIVTNNPEYGARLRRIKDFGREAGGIDVHPEFGINSKFTDVQASIGLSQLTQLPERIAKKRWIYRQYQELLKDIKEIMFIQTDLTCTVPWFVDIYTDLRDDLYNFLSSRSIGTRKVYPTLHQQPCYKDQYANAVGSPFLTAEWFSRRGLWLPCSLSITQAQIEFVVSNIREFFDAFRSAS